MHKTTLQKINIDNIVDVMIEPNQFDINNFTYKDVYSVIEKNGSRKEIVEGDYKALLRILKVRQFRRSL